MPGPTLPRLLVSVAIGLALWQILVAGMELAVQAALLEMPDGRVVHRSV